MAQLFPNIRRPTRKVPLENLTIRGWPGGLNSVESDISMDARYCKVLNNFRRKPDGTQVLRYGNHWHTDVVDVVSGDVIDQAYFANAIISVTEDGEIAATDEAGVSTAIWNEAIANGLFGSPSGWSTGLTTVNFVPNKGNLIIHNGVDKPITIDQDLLVTYLQDLATGSNTNVPIGKYGATVSNYHVVGGIPADPTVLYISSQGAAGTFPGDPAPNDSITIDVGAYAPEGAPEIRGLAGFRSNLIVFFQSQSVVITLGTYDVDDNHVPEFPDAAPSFGLLGHRCIVRVGNDLLFAGLHGIGSVKRNLVSGLLDTVPVSNIVEPSYTAIIGTLTDTQQLNECFTVYDKLNRAVILYTPSGDAITYNINEELRYKSWCTDSGPAWKSACGTTLGRVFYSIGSRVFRGGNGVFADENYHADRLMDRDADWTTGHSYQVDDIAFDTETDESYICVDAHISGGTTFEDDRTEQAADPKWELYEGEDIEFEMEMPWLDGRDPMQVKINKFVSLATKGTATFTLRVWVDNLYKDADGEVIHDPALEMEFVGNDAPGFGYDAGPYGGGRRSNDPRLFAYPVKFKSIKPSITGATKKPLEIATMSFLYIRGRYHR